MELKRKWLAKVKERKKEPFHDKSCVMGIESREKKIFYLRRRGLSNERTGKNGD